MSYLSRRKLTKYQGIERGEIKSLKIQFEWLDDMEWLHWCHSNLEGKSFHTKTTVKITFV